MYRAFDATGAEQVHLARQALKASPDCADAYVLLAEHAETADEAQKLYEQGVAAGERALGPDAFVENEGHFWGVLETRPYMRARQGLAQCLWEAGRREEAAGHVRAKGLLKKATKTNRHIPANLLGHKQLPHDLPPYISVGGIDEAMSYAVGNRRAWLNTLGAISWLRKTLDVPLPRSLKSRRPSWPQVRLALWRCPFSRDVVVDHADRSTDPRCQQNPRPRS